MTKPRKELSEVAPSTSRRRVKQALSYSQCQAGKTTESLNKCQSAMLQRISTADRESILHNIGLRGEISKEEGLAMVADLNLTWYTYRAWGQ